MHPRLCFFMGVYLPLTTSLSSLSLSLKLTTSSTGMKRLSSSDSLGGLNLISICPNSTDDAVYTREFQTMLEGLEEEESGGHSSEKKRRLGVDQVKALEKNFEVENKLEPDRKVKLAQELGLQPRQVAVWFQNRRARWKTKQLERDYGALKANYDDLMLNFESLKHNNESLLKEIHELKSKLEEEKNDEDDGGAASGEEIKNVMNNNNINNGGKKSWPKFGDGWSDSDSSAILTEENNSNSPRGEGVLGSRLVGFELGHGSYEAQMVKIEEHNFFGEESCTTLFSDDQAPTLQQWYCNDEWN